MILVLGGTPNGVKTSPATGVDEPTDDPVVGLLVSERCEHLIREFLGDTEEDVGTTSARDGSLDCLRDAVMGATSTDW